MDHLPSMIESSDLTIVIYGTPNINDFDNITQPIIIDRIIRSCNKETIAMVQPITEDLGEMVFAVLNALSVTVEIISTEIRLNDPVIHLLASELWHYANRNIVTCNRIPFTGTLYAFNTCKIEVPLHKRTGKPDYYDFFVAKNNDAEFWLRNSDTGAVSTNVRGIADYINKDINVISIFTLAMLSQLGSRQELLARITELFILRKEAIKYLANIPSNLSGRRLLPASHKQYINEEELSETTFMVGDPAEEQIVELLVGLINKLTPIQGITPLARIIREYAYPQNLVSEDHIHYNDIVGGYICAYNSLIDDYNLDDAYFKCNKLAGLINGRIVSRRIRKNNYITYSSEYMRIQPGWENLAYEAIIYWLVLLQYDTILAEKAFMVLETFCGKIDLFIEHFTPYRKAAIDYLVQQAK